MRKMILLIATASIAACGAPAPAVQTQNIPVSSPVGITSSETPKNSRSEEEAQTNIDILANLSDPDCSKGLTPSNQEGPYYMPDTPERTSLLEEGMEGDKLILAGYVLTPDCLPIPNIWLDFWQANSKGEYDNAGYALRGHQFTDNKGRYYLETIMPGLYASRPIEHIHVKLQVGRGDVFTTQLYFPDQPVDGLTVNLEEKNGYYFGSFDFVIQP